MSNIKQLIKRNEPKFPEWNRQLGEQQLAEYAPSEIERQADRERIFFQTNELLVAIARSFFEHGNFKDTWDTSKCRMFPFGQYILLRSEKMDITFDWGVEYSDFYLEACIVHTENIRYMTDDFWSVLLELKTLGKFEYTGGGGLNAEQKPYFENTTSTVFQVIRTFMFNQTELMNNRYGRYTQRELGSLQLKWPMDNDWPKLLEQACRAFRLLYKLNYQLWKISDISNKKSASTSRLQRT
jgi:hypothetical protein